MILVDRIDSLDTRKAINNHLLQTVELKNAKFYLMKLLPAVGKSVEGQTYIRLYCKSMLESSAIMAHIKTNEGVVGGWLSIHC